MLATSPGNLRVPLHRASLRDALKDQLIREGSR
jgi:hypothetical protein